MKYNYTGDIFFRIAILIAVLAICLLINYGVKHRKFLTDNQLGDYRFQKLSSHNSLGIWSKTFFVAFIMALSFCYWDKINGSFLATLFFVLSVIFFQLMVLYPDLLFIRIVNRVSFDQSKLMYKSKNSQWYFKQHQTLIGRKVAYNLNKQIAQNYHKLSICDSMKERSFKIDLIIDSINNGRHLEQFEANKSAHRFKSKIFLFFLAIMTSFMLYVHFYYINEMGLIKIGAGESNSYYNFSLYFISLGQSGITPANPFTESFILLCWVPFLFTFALLFTSFKDFIDIRFNTVTSEVNKLFLYHKEILTKLKFDMENNLVTKRMEDWKLKLKSETCASASILLATLEDDERKNVSKK